MRGEVWISACHCYSSIACINEEVRNISRRIGTVVFVEGGRAPFAIRLMGSRDMVRVNFLAAKGALAAVRSTKRRSRRSYSPRPAKQHAATAPARPFGSLRHKLSFGSLLSSVNHGRIRCGAIALTYACHTSLGRSTLNFIYYKSLIQQTPFGVFASIQ